MFDKEKFSVLLNNIIVTYYNDNIAEFARTVHFDRTYASKYIHCRLDSPPTPKTLKKIAEGSKGMTTYEELMQICGYVNWQGLFGINMNDKEIKVLTDMLLDYKIFLDTKNSLDRFNEEKYLKKLSNDSKNKILTAFRTNSLNIIMNTKYDNDIDDDTQFKFTCEDDAMYPLLDVGDIAFIYKTNLIEDTISSYKGTYLINLDGQSTIRKIILDEANSCYQLTAMNNYCKTICIPKDEIYNKIKILGKVTKAENTSAFKQ